MSKFALSRGELTQVIALFVAGIIAFAVLGEVAGWPSGEGGWPIALLAAAILAGMGPVSRLIDAAEASKATVTLPGGLRLEFAQAVVHAPAGDLPTNLVAPEVEIADSARQELNRVAGLAADQEVVVVDLEAGRAWYRSRLFALGATATLLERPLALVVVGRRAGSTRQLGGWILPRDLLQAFIDNDARLAWHWQHARAYLTMLQVGQKAGGTKFPQFQNYQAQYGLTGDRLIMRILVEQMRDPDQTESARGTSLTVENPERPEWVTLADAERLLESGLVTESIELTEPANEQERVLIRCEHGYLMRTKNARYVDMLDTRKAQRHLLEQFVEQARRA